MLSAVAVSSRSWCSGRTRSAWLWTTVRDLVEHVFTELVRHSVAGEQYLYPTVRRVLPNGDQADHELKEHAEAEEVMKAIEKTDAQDPKFDELVGKLIEDIRHHVQEEESDLLPQLRTACDAAELDELGEKFENSKKMAPTRPHLVGAGPTAGQQDPGSRRGSYRPYARRDHRPQHLNAGLDASRRSAACD